MVQSLQHIDIRFVPKVALLLAVLVSAGAAENGGRYLVVAPDSFVDALQPLVNWKARKGVPVRVAPLSETGSQPAQIISFIRNAHETWPVPPEYVLIAGAPNIIRSSRLRTDDGYGDVAGDHQVELPVGRFFCATVAQCSTLVAKTLTYEKTPYAAGDSGWMLKGTTIVNEDNTPDTYYQPDCRYIRGLWNTAGFTQTESLMDLWGDSSRHVQAAINDGRGYAVYRGQCIANWWPPFDRVNPNTMTNGFRLPVLVSGSCETVTVDSGETMLADVFVRAGTPVEPRGAVAYFGTTNAGAHVSLNRSLVTRGFFTAVFVEGRYHIGDACVRGKFILDSVLPNGMQYLYEEWTLLGDPEMPLWTARPSSLAAEFDHNPEPGSRDFAVRVKRDGAPLAGALVCLQMDTTVYAAGTTDDSGDVTLPVEIVNEGAMYVTATARNCVPFEDSAAVGHVGVTVRAGLSAPALTLSCRPNPTDGRTTIRLSAAGPAFVEVEVYGSDGRLVRSLFSGRGTAGALLTYWDGRAADGRAAPAGVYVVRARSPDRAVSSKLLVQR
jgi:hypothetical protein